MRAAIVPSAIAAIAATSSLGAAPPVGATGLERLVLPNGLEVIFARRTGVPLVTVEIAIRAGAFIETPDLDGLTHLHEHMFFKANRAIPDQAAYLRRLEELGMNWNGSTSHEVVRYYFTLPSELIREGLEFLRDAIQSPLFLREELEKERQVVLGEYDRNEANPAFHLRRALEKALFGRNFSRKNVIGDRQVIATATREKLQFIQDEFYIPNNASLIVCGDFDPREARRLAGEVFGGWERRPDPFARHPVPEHPSLTKDEFLVVEQDVRTASLLLGWHGPCVDRSFHEAVVADLLSTALNHPAGRFHKALVDSGLATRATFHYYTLKHVGPISVQIETTPDKLLSALAAARAELDALARPGYLSPEELNRAANELIADDAFDREKSREYANLLGFWWSVGGIESYLSLPREARRVGPADVERFARAYLPAGGASGAVGAMVSPAARKAAGISPETLARAFAGDGRAPAAGSGEPQVSSEELPGAARLLTKTIAGADVAALGIYFGGLAGRSRPEEGGLEQLLLQTLAEGLERSEADELARLGARVRYRVDADFSLFGIQCPRDGLARSAELLGGALRRLELRPEDIERNRARMLDAYAKSLDNPDLAVAYVVNRTFYPPGHPYLAYPGGTEESLKRIRMEDLQKRRARLLAGKRILAVAVGDIEPAAARELAGRVLGDLAAGEADATAVPSAGGDPGRVTTEEKSIPTCYVLGRFAAPAPGEADYDALSVALAVLHRKLFLEVRTKRALTYAVMSGLAERARNSGYLYVTSPRPSEALGAMYQTVEDLIQTPLPAEDLRAAVLAFTTRYYQRQESAAEQADALAQAELVAGDHRRALDLRARLVKVAPEDIQRVLARYVRGIHFAVLGPTDQLANVDRELFTRGPARREKPSAGDAASPLQEPARR